MLEGAECEGGGDLQGAEEMMRRPRTLSWRTPSTPSVACISAVRVVPYQPLTSDLRGSMRSMFPCVDDGHASRVESAVAGGEVPALGLRIKRYPRRDQLNRASPLRIHRKQILAPTAANGIRRQNQFADPGNMVPPRESDDAPVRAS